MLPENHRLYRRPEHLTYDMVEDRYDSVRKITSDQVKYDVVDSYGKLMELVK